MRRDFEEEKSVTEECSVLDRVISAIQYPLPHHFLSRLIFAFMRISVPAIKNMQIRLIVAWYGVNVAEALEEDFAAYRTFNDFFVRKLKPSARPLEPEPRAIASPVDGVVSQGGPIDGGRIFQAKGRSYSLEELLGCGADDHERARPFRDGLFTTLYLSPKDYHRIHMPLAGELREMIHVPGRLFSVNPATTRGVPRLFARNERVCAIFETEAGPMALILVGALFVSAIETVWSGLVTPPAGRSIRATSYRPGEITLAKGTEMGRFNMGSTVILLFGADRAAWDDELRPRASVRMGRRIGAIMSGL